MFSIAGHTVTTQFNISVVDYNSLFMYATPYPIIYNESNTIKVNQLYKIANTGMHQQVIFYMFMILTDKSTVELVFLHFMNLKICQCRS